MPNPWFALIGVIAGYACAWVGHFLLERNRPRTFTQPLYLVAGDFRMTFKILTRRRPLDERHQETAE